MKLSTKMEELIEALITKPKEMEGAVTTSPENNQEISETPYEQLFKLISLDPNKIDPQNSKDFINSKDFETNDFDLTCHKGFAALLLILYTYKLQKPHTHTSTTPTDPAPLNEQNNTSTTDPAPLNKQNNGLQTKLFKPIDVLTKTQLNKVLQLIEEKIETEKKNNNTTPETYFSWDNFNKLKFIKKDNRIEFTYDNDNENPNLKKYLENKYPTMDTTKTPNKLYQDLIKRFGLNSLFYIATSLLGIMVTALIVGINPAVLVTAALAAPIMTFISHIAILRFSSESFWEQKVKNIAPFYKIPLKLLQEKYQILFGLKPKYILEELFLNMPLRQIAPLTMKRQVIITSGIALATVIFSVVALLDLIPGTNLSFDLLSKSGLFGNTFNNISTSYWFYAAVAALSVSAIAGVNTIINLLLFPFRKLKFENQNLELPKMLINTPQEQNTLNISLNTNNNAENINTNTQNSTEENKEEKTPNALLDNPALDPELSVNGFFNWMLTANITSINRQWVDSLLKKAKKT